MKKLIIAFSTVLLLVPLTLALAQENSATTTRPQKPRLLPSSLPRLGPTIKNIASTTRANVQSAATTTREVGKMRAEEVKQRALERFGEVVHKHVRIITERLNAAMERLTDIAARLESRIEKLESEGRDMTNSVALLAEAEVSIGTAQDAVANVSIVLEAALDSDTPREHMGKVREAIQEAKDALKNAKDALMEVIRSIKVAVQ